VTTLDRAQTSLTQLDDALAEAFDREQHGFSWYASIQDPKVQVVRSNQLISLVDAADSHLDALGDAAQQLREVVGPNGLTMPAVDDADERAKHVRVSVEITDGLRAAGSLLDVLGGMSVLLLGLPVAPTYADSRHLLRTGPAPAGAPEAQAQAIERADEVVAGAVQAGPPGWIEWTVESRNAMVHRGRAISSWLPVPAPVDRGRIVVVADTEPHRLMRYFPHLRRMPDLSDAETVLRGVEYRDMFLNEPAQDTLDGLREQAAALTAAVVDEFRDGLGNLGDFAWPAEWGLAERTSRAGEADAFNGFDPARPAPATDAIFLNPRTAERLFAAEEIRLAEQGEDGAEAAT
jgi:hypothetical protein